MIKTNAMRILEEAKIEFTPYAYDSKHGIDALSVATCLGKDPHRIFKTLVVVSPDFAHFVCVVPATAELDLKKAARAAHVKSLEMIPLKKLQPTTGYVHGGCSPVGMKKPLPTFFHVSALDHPKIYVSAGQRGMQLIIAPQDLINFVGGTAVDLIKD